MDPVKVLKAIFSVFKDCLFRSVRLIFNNWKYFIFGAPSTQRIKDIIKTKPFYEDKDYEQKLTRELDGTAPPIVYVYETNRFLACGWLIKDLFSVLTIVGILYRATHALVGKFAILPSATPPILGFPLDVHRAVRARFDTSKFKMKRVSIVVRGLTIDALIVGTPETLKKDRWTLFAFGNGELFELLLSFDRSLLPLIDNLKTNAVLFNYPGVGDSQGFPNRKLMAKVERALLQFLEDSENGVGAKEIIMWGHSIGGAAQAEAIEGYPFKQGIKHLFVKSRSFTTLRETVLYLTGSNALGFLVSFTGWNVSSVKSSTQLQKPELLLQTVKGITSYTDLSHNKLEISSDGVVDAKASLGAYLISNCQQNRNKYFLGMPERHNDGIKNTVALSAYMENVMKTI